MNCSDGKPCSFPCRKMTTGAVRIDDLPEGCPLRAPDPDATDKTILDPWRGKKLGARSILGFADLAAGAFSAAEKEETLARFDTGGRISKSAYKGLATYRESVRIWKRKDRAGNPPTVPTKKIYRLFMAAQNAAGKCDQLLDWIAEQKWVAGVPATVQRYLSAELALPPVEAFDEEKIFVYELEDLAGKKK